MSAYESEHPEDLPCSDWEPKRDCPIEWCEGETILCMECGHVIECGTISTIEK
jgi:hypothetical protein